MEIDHVIVRAWACLGDWAVEVSQYGTDGPGRPRGELLFRARGKQLDATDKRALLESLAEELFNLATLD